MTLPWSLRLKRTLGSARSKRVATSSGAAAVAANLASVRHLNLGCFSASWRRARISAVSSGAERGREDLDQARGSPSLMQPLRGPLPRLPPRCD
jgi:hypothetical protein